MFASDGTKQWLINRTKELFMNEAMQWLTKETKEQLMSVYINI